MMQPIAAPTQSGRARGNIFREIFFQMFWCVLTVSEALQSYSAPCCQSRFERVRTYLWSSEPWTEPTIRSKNRTGPNLNLRFGSSVRGSNRGSGPNFGIPSRNAQQMHYQKGGVEISVDEMRTSNKQHRTTYIFCPLAVLITFALPQYSRGPIATSCFCITIVSNRMDCLSFPVTKLTWREHNLVMRVVRRE
jgi:hypothetical protein